MKRSIVLRRIEIILFLNVLFIPVFSDNIGGHEYVDLGLPSGTLWAKWNLGAKSEMDPGQFFAWGEVKSKDKKMYTRASYKYHRSKTVVNQIKTTKYLLTKYNYNKTYGDVDNKKELDNIDDAVIAQWGDLWCMPTKDQIYELINNCKWESYYENGRMLVKVTGGNKNYIIFPIYGFYKEYQSMSAAPYYSKGNNTSSLTGEDEYSYYWTKSLGTSYPDCSIAFQVGRNKFTSASLPRNIGANIKAVVSKKGIDQINSSIPDNYDEYAKDGESFSISNTFPFDIRTYYIIGKNEVNSNAIDEELYNKMLTRYKSLKVTPKMLMAQKEGKGTLSYFLLGYCSYKGLGTTLNKDTSLKWFREGSSKGDFRCTVMMFALGLTDNRNQSDMAQLSNAAKQGYMPAEMISLYMQSIRRQTRYLDEKNIDIFSSEESERAKKLVSLGSKYAEAKYMCGKVYKNQTWIEVAASHGLTYAIYETVIELDKQRKYKEAYKYMLMGLKSGVQFSKDVESRVRMIALAQSENPEDVAKALKESFELGNYVFVKSAYNNALSRNVTNGDIVAYYAMAIRALGVNDKQDKTNCFNLFKKSAEDGSVVGMVGLAESYEKGFGLDAIDMNSAFMWYKKAAQGGSEKAKKYFTNRNMKW